MKFFLMIVNVSALLFWSLVVIAEPPKSIIFDKENYGDSAAPLNSYPQTPTFDCSAKLNTVERLICNDPKLGLIDQLFFDLYKITQENMTDEQKSELTKNQLEWLKKRDRCVLVECVVHEYDVRSYDLERGKHIRPSRSRLIGLLSADYQKYISEKNSNPYSESTNSVPSSVAKIVSVEESIKKLLLTDEKSKREAAFYITSYYTDSGAKGDIFFIRSNIDIFLKALDDPLIAVQITEVLAGRFISTENGGYFVYLSTEELTKKEKAIEKFLKNLKSSDPLIAKTSAEALLNVSGCTYKSEIKERAIRNKENINNLEYSIYFKYIFSSLDEKCK